MMEAALNPAELSAYLDRIGVDVGSVRSPSLAGLAHLQLAHLLTVPFENLEVYARRRVRADDRWAFEKVVGRRRGGWCFEANGAFAQLLRAAGYPVIRLGAAVLLDGPNQLIDHLALEVTLDEPYLVDVGFGSQGPIVPLPLNRPGPIETPAGRYEFMASPHGTTLVRWVDGTAQALYRFKRVDHRLADFEPASDRLQADRDLHWSTKPFATRLIDGSGDRITLTAKGLSLTRGDRVERSPVAPGEWPELLFEHFGIDDAVDPLVQDAGSDGICGS